MKLFGADWCGPCGTTKTKLKELGFDIVEAGAEIVGERTIEFVNIDKNMELARQNGVRGIPLLIDGEERFSGYDAIINRAKSKL